MTMNNAEAESSTKADGPLKIGKIVEETIKSRTDAIVKRGVEAEHLLESNADTMAKTGTAALAGLKELAKEYQAIASRNSARFTSSIYALTTVKTPQDYMELQRRLFTESVQSAIADFQTIAKLTTAAFNVSFDPLRRHVDRELHKVV
jgi:hypothetical protein